MNKRSRITNKRKGQITAQGESFDKFVAKAYEVGRKEALKFSAAPIVPWGRTSERMNKGWKVSIKWALANQARLKP